jgi:hypothetical protein
LSGVCQVKNTFPEFFYFWKIHKTIVIIGGRGGIRTHGRIAPTPDFEREFFIFLIHQKFSPSKISVKTLFVYNAQITPSQNPNLEKGNVNFL